MKKITVSKKVLKKLRSKKRTSKNKLKHLERLLARYGSNKRKCLIYKLVMDNKLSDHLRCALVLKIEDIPGLDSVHALRLLTHDKSASRTLRVRAFYSLGSMDDILFHVDVASLLGDPDEAIWMRADAAEKIGGLCLTCLQPLIMDILQKNEVHEDILFWCLYACTGFESSDALQRAIEPYCQDMRLVHTGMKSVGNGLATLASEAKWARDHLLGLSGDPEWMVVDS